SSLTDMLGRHAAVLSELSELTSGRTVCEEFRTAMAKKDAPSAHLYYASGDALVPSRELSAATTGLPFTTRNVYDGGQAGHTRFIYDPTLPAKIFADESTSPHDIAA
ncbi:MAG TPA: hypothetical protein VFQ70_03990, partial [Candidatus Saccharimonadaceae bacterium]|nr:hypothetical protein [Candidatus Saccharimonadaceae bacterium]